MPRYAIFHPFTFSLLSLLCLARPVWATGGEAVSLSQLSYDAKRHSLVFHITGPLTVGTLSLRSPPRLVVDLPDAVLLAGMRRLEINDRVIKRARISQYAFFPPVVRVVIETAGTGEPVLAIQQTSDHLYITLAAERAQGYAAPAHKPFIHRPLSKSQPPKPPGILGEPGLQPLPDVSPLITSPPHSAPLPPPPTLRPTYIPAPPPYQTPNLPSGVSKALPKSS